MTNSAHRTSCHFLPIERISEPYHERRRHNKELWRTSRANLLNKLFLQSKLPFLVSLFLSGSIKWLSKASTV
ncbi:hypothetical protein EE612_053362 [Oryza sativa]|nr:hypothetical protein EE612_053362 [Oryza sativa]